MGGSLSTLRSTDWAANWGGQPWEPGAADEPLPGAFGRRRVLEPDGTSQQVSVRAARNAARVGDDPAGGVRLRSRVANVAAGTVEPAPKSGPRELPWLTPEQCAELRVTRARLRAVQREQWGLVWECLSEACREVRRAEDFAERAHELLEMSRTQLPSDDELRELYYLLRETRREMPRCQGVVNAALGPLEGNNDISPADAGLVDDLQVRLDNVHDFFGSCGPPWRGETRRIETTLPIATGKRAAVDCIVVSGRALAAYCGDDFPAGAGAGEGEICATRYLQAPDLSLTGLCNTGGRMLFAGLSHGVFHAHELNAGLLARMSDDQVEFLFRDYHARWIREEYSEPGRAMELAPLLAERDRQRLRTVSVQDAEALVRLLKLNACRNAFLRTVEAAIVAEPEQLNRALDGDDVNLNLFSIAVLTPEDVGVWHTQYNHLCGNQMVRTLLTRRTGGQVSSLTPFTANVNVRQFALSAAVERSGSDACAEINRQATLRLLGPMAGEELGGDVKTSVDDLKARAGELRERVDSTNRGYHLTSKQLGEDHAITRAVARDLARLSDDLARTEKDARTLEQAAAQLKRMWIWRGDWPTGIDAHRRAAARLALMGYLMGETPLLCCVSGRDFVERLEAEVLFLATVADSAEGNLPPVDLHPGLWRDAREAFLPAASSGSPPRAVIRPIR